MTRFTDFAVAAAEAAPKMAAALLAEFGSEFEAAISARDDRTELKQPI